MGKETVKRAIDEGLSGGGRGIVLQPSTSPYGRTISGETLEHYRTMVQLVN